MPIKRGVLLCMIAANVASGQLPRSATLSESDARQFHAEISRIEALLRTATDRNTVTYVLARTWASAEQWPEAVLWLRKAAEAKCGLDPGRDRVFAPIRGTQEFEAVLRAVRDATPPVLKSRIAFANNEADLMPESIAWDPQAKAFYLGSMTKGKVVRCSAAGECRDFITGLATVLGVKVDRSRLYILSNADETSELIVADTRSARINRRYSVGRGHLFNDLAVAPNGDIYITDTRGNGVWRLAHGGEKLSRAPGTFEAANGIAVSSDGSVLYVSTFPEGIAIVDLSNGQKSALSGPPNLCLANVDGLTFYSDNLIAIQNGMMSPRVVRIVLKNGSRAVERFEVLERRNPRFEGVTTGVIAGDEFFYMANIQDEKESDFEPITVLSLQLK